MHIRVLGCRFQLAYKGLVAADSVRGGGNMLFLVYRVVYFGPWVLFEPVIGLPEVL